MQSDKNTSGMAGGKLSSGFARGARPSVAVLLCSGFIALTQLVGWSFAKARAAGSIDPAFPPLPVSVIAVLVLWVLLYAALALLFRWFDRSRLHQGKDVSRKEERRAFMVVFVLMVLCWLPYLLAFLPGSLPWDGVRSMNQFITDAPLENHHPVLMNALYAGLMTLGRSLYSDNAGLLLIVLFQYLVCAVSFSLMIRQMIAMRSPRWLVVATTAFFCLCPLWGVFAQAAFKDTLFNGVFCLFVLEVVKNLNAGTKGLKPHWLTLFAFSLIVCFVRNNGVYIVLPTLLALMLYFALAPRKDRKARARVASSRTSSVLAVASVAVAVAAVFFCATKLLWPAMGVETREDKELMSVPFQQTARYLVEHPDDVTESEWAAIDAILPFDELAGLYNPDLSDPVKESMRDEGGIMDADERAEYFAAWASMGLRHPATYARATLANTYAYFYPGIIIGQDIDRPVFPLYIQGLPINKEFDVWYIGSAEVREAVEGVLADSLDLPVISAVYSPALYVLALLVVAAYALSRKDALTLVVVLPCFVLLLTVLAGPLNGHLRYVLPLAAALPLLYACALRVPAKAPQG
ncbi:hypothetical protein B5F44_06500 [Gordonibacter urolithinfaciens]|uniref:DUF6020 family protein n=1 Tax=Gordonibacter urolithinfaciens TaxID=1335613 RepID=UPI000B3774F1|nr:DUF6020 family protein [Gordonibacter urolithinfaciens]OUO87437.1 hypothetical protein B5F44_06500 [Gordonibacter urolithinfaciens]